MSGSSESTPAQMETASSSLLSFPTPTPSEEPVPSTSQPRSLLKDRLYVGNLHPSVDEYTLLQVFSKYGKVSKLDFLFHKTGPHKGKPRGYAFIEYTNQDDAAKALVSVNDKLIRGRKAVVTYAHQAPVDEAAMGGSRPRRIVSEAGKPTTLSLLKSSGSSRSATEDKIAKMEAKLRQLEQSTPEPPLHYSLPPKPVAIPSAASQALHAEATKNSGRQSVRSTAPLPSFPIVNPQPAKSSKPSTPGIHLAPSTSTSASSTPRKGTPALTGVKIVKAKNR